MADELVRAVREHLADEVAKVIGGRRGNGAPNGHAIQGRRRRGVSEAVLVQLMKAIKAAPGLRSEQLYKKVTASPRVAKAGLAKLREQKRVRTSGERRSTTYRAV